MVRPGIPAEDFARNDLHSAIPPHPHKIDFDATLGKHLATLGLF
jgi:hypothetical protein